VLFWLEPIRVEPPNGPRLSCGALKTDSFHNLPLRDHTNCDIETQEAEDRDPDHPEQGLPASNRCEQVSHDMPRSTANGLTARA